MKNGSALVYGLVASWMAGSWRWARLSAACGGGDWKLEIAS